MFDIILKETFNLQAQYAQIVKTFVIFQSSYCIELCNLSILINKENFLFITSELIVTKKVYQESFIENCF